MRELPDLLPQLAPPPGGELRLRHALRSARAQRPAARWVAASALVAGITAVAVLGWRPSPEQRELERTLQATLAPTPPLVVEGGSARRLPSADPAVRIYLVMTADVAPPR